MMLKMLCLCFVDFNISNVRIFISVLIESNMANTEQIFKGEGAKQDDVTGPALLSQVETIDRRYTAAEYMSIW